MYTENLKNEIKGILDQDAEHREMLFRRGYLLTDRRQTDVDVYPFYGLWREVCVGQYYLYVHKDQTFYICTKGSVAAVMVGHAYNPFDMKHIETELCEDLIAAYEKGLDAYFDKLSEFTGLHVIFLIDGDRLIACQDACGLTGCYFGKIQVSFYVAEHPQLVADLCDLSMDPMVKKLVESKCYNIGNRHLPGNTTPYKELKRLGPNTYLDYQKAFTVKRFYPTCAHPEFKTVDDQEAATKRIADLIHNGIACCAKKWEKGSISLSGGTDSKTTLACANGLYDRFSYFSFHSKPQELVDAQGAKTICRQLGLEHTLYTIPEENNAFQDFELVKKILQHNTSYFVNLADNEIRKYIFLHDLNAYDVELKSWASEVVRVFFERKYGIKMPCVLTERHGSIFQTRYFGHPALLKWSDRKYYQFLKEVGLRRPLYNYEHADLFYWELRMGCWGVSVTSSQQLYHRTTMPMNNRKILELFLGFPREDRIKDDVHKRVMEYKNKNVVDAHVEIPNLYFHSYRILVEKLYYMWRTMFYRPIKEK